MSGNTNSTSKSPFFLHFMGAFGAVFRIGENKRQLKRTEIQN